MKKEDAVESIARAGHTINDLNVRVWTTALNPTHYGWGYSLASIAAIPVLSMASVGQLVSSAVVNQISPSVFEKLPDLSPPPKDGGDSSR
jgi:hypothetical protein